MVYFIANARFRSMVRRPIQIRNTASSNNGALGRRGSCTLSVVRLPAFGGRSTRRLCMQMQSKAAWPPCRLASAREPAIESALLLYIVGHLGVGRPRLILVCRMVSECTVGVREPPPLLSPQLVHLWSPASPVHASHHRCVCLVHQE
jgi:hypothetical protein